MRAGGHELKDRKGIWPWPPTLLLDCIPERDGDNQLMGVRLRLSLGEPGDDVDAGCMRREAVHEGLRLVGLLSQDKSSRKGWTIPEEDSGWLWDSLVDLPAAIATLRERPGPFHGFEQFVFSVMAPDEVAILPWEQLQVPVMRRTLQHPPTGLACSALMRQLGTALTCDLGRPFFVPLDHLQLMGRLAERIDGDPETVALEHPSMPFDMALLNLDRHPMEEDALRLLLAERGIGLACLVLPPAEEWPDLDGLLRLQRIAVTGAGVPVVFGNRHPVSAASAEAALESFVEQVINGGLLSTCVKNVQKEHGLGWVLWCNLRDQPFLRQDPPGAYVNAPVEEPWVLESGQVGAPVRKLQQRLERLGLPVGSARCDGIFGPGTELAVRVLQRWGGLEPDGRVQVATWSLMDRIERRAGPPPISGVIPHGYRPALRREVLGTGLAGPEVLQIERQGRYLFGTAALSAGMLDEQATSRWAESQQALGLFPARTFDPWGTFAGSSGQDACEGELRWIPRWLWEHVLGEIPDSAEAIIDARAMERLLEAGPVVPAPGAAGAPARDVPRCTRAALERMLAAAAEHRVLAVGPGDGAPAPGRDPRPDGPPRAPDVPPIVAFLEGWAEAAEVAEPALSPAPEVKVGLETGELCAPDASAWEHDEFEELAGQDHALSAPAPWDAGQAPRLLEEDLPEPVAEPESAARANGGVLARMELSRRSSGGASAQEGAREAPAGPGRGDGSGLHQEVQHASRASGRPETTGEEQSLTLFPLQFLEQQAPDPQAVTPGGGSATEPGPDAFQLERTGVGEPLEEMKDEWRDISTWSARPPVSGISTLPVWDVVGDEPFYLPPRGGALEAVLDAVHLHFSLPLDVTGRLLTELHAGRHVVLVGPTGSGKTTLARCVARALGYFPLVATPTAGWTSRDVLGQLGARSPAAAEADASLPHQLVFRPGVMLESVLANWEELPAEGGGGVVWRRVGKGLVGQGGPRAKGCWLVLDEMNRGDLDLCLGSLLEALETRRARIPCCRDTGGTVEVPIPEDYRVIATLNTADRHSLFRLSAALRRRFAFVEVPVATHLGDEWKRISRAIQLPGTGAGHDWQRALPEDELLLLGDLRRFIYLARAFFPVGSGHVVAAVRYLMSSAAHALLTPEQRLHQALAGSLLPGFEGIRLEVLGLLQVWAAPVLRGAAERAADPSGNVHDQGPGSTWGDLAEVLVDLHGLMDDEVSMAAWLDTLEVGWPDAQGPGGEPLRSDISEGTIRLARCLARRGGPYSELAHQLWWMAQESENT